MMASTLSAEAVIGPDLARLWKTRQDKERFQWSSLALMTPAFGLLIILFLIPMGYAVYLGFTNLTLVGPTSVQWGFTGLQNLSRLRQDTTFWSSVWVTAGFVGGSILGAVGLGYWVASRFIAARARVGGGV